MIVDIIKGLQTRRPDVELQFGTPQSEAEIAALEAELGCKFPEDYREFLREYGALVLDEDTGTMYGMLSVRGIGAPEADLRSGPEELADECRRWGRDPIEYVPFLGYAECGVEDSYAFDEDGAIYFLYRGTADLREGATFSDLLAELLGELEKDLDQTHAEEVRTDTVLGDLEARLGESCRRDGARLYVANADGHEVMLRLGDRREFDYGPSGLFMLWREPANGRTIGDLFALNRELYCTRGSLVEDEVRFRGRLLLSGLDGDSVAHVLHHDAGVGAPAPFTRRLRAEDVDEWLNDAGSFFSDYANVLRTSPTTWTFDSIHAQIRYGRTLTFHASLTDNADSLWLRIVLEGAELPTEEIVARLNEYNRGMPLIDGDADVNFDMENFHRASLTADGQVLLEHRLPPAAVTDGIKTFVSELLSAAGNALSDLDIRTPLPTDQFETWLGLPPGPVTLGIAEQVSEAKRNGHPPFASIARGIPWFHGIPRSPSAFDSTWGAVRPFMDASDGELIRDAVILGIVTSGAAQTTDECPVIAYHPWGDKEGEAVLVAPDVAGLLSLLAIDATGLCIFDEVDAERARRRYFETYPNSSTMNFVAWIRSLGVEPAEDPLAVVNATGLARHGRVELSVNKEAKQ